MEPTELLEFAGLVLGIVGVFVSRARDFAAWGVVAIAVALLWPVFT